MKASDWATRLPWSIVLIAALLACCGCLGIARAEQLAHTSGRMTVQQIVWSILALIVMLLVTIPNYRRLCRGTYLAFGVSLLLLIVVYAFPPIGYAHRWIRLGGIGFQPSELAKITFVLALARYLMYRENYRWLGGLLVPLVLTLVPVLLILREPDLGTAIVFLPVLFAMLYAAGARRRDLAVLCLVGCAVLPVLWTQMSREQMSRVTALLEPITPGQRPSADAYHLYQARRTMAVGGIWGTALGPEPLDAVRRYSVPAAHTDSIYSVLGERFGIVGVALLLLLYFLLAWRGLVIAQSTREPFGRLLAVGIVALFSVQAVINTGMMAGLLPITGLSLPLVSYGGSGLVAGGLALGLLMNISMRPGYEVTGEPFVFR